MFVKRDEQEENRLINDLINEDPTLKAQHELFEEEMRFKQLLIEARKEKELTQKDVSEKSGLSQQAVSRLEKGHGGNIDTVLRYLNSIGYTLSLKEL